MHSKETETRHSSKKANVLCQFENELLIITLQVQLLNSFCTQPNIVYLAHGLSARVSCKHQSLPGVKMTFMIIPYPLLLCLLQKEVGLDLSKPSHDTPR